MMSAHLFSSIVLTAVIFSVANGKSFDYGAKPRPKPNRVKDVRMHVNVREDDVTTSEDVELNYVENYVRLSTPGSHGATPSVLIHDYNRNLTLYKNNGRCFVMTQYPGLPSTLKDWEKLQDAGAEGFDVSGRRRNYIFKQLQFSANRTSLPDAMQRECPGEVLVADLLQISATPPVTEETTLVGEIFRPEQEESGIRQKRQTYLVVETADDVYIFECPCTITLQSENDETLAVIEIEK